MNSRTSILLPALAMLMALGSLGCSKDDTGTNPPPPGELNSGNFDNGQRWVHTFANAGTYGYHCSIHPVMRSSITVATGGLDSLIVLIMNTSSTGFQPQSVGGSTTVKPGGYVSWQNQSVTHNVTSH